MTSFHDDELSDLEFIPSDIDDSFACSQHSIISKMLEGELHKFDAGFQETLNCLREQFLFDLANQLQLAWAEKRKALIAKLQATLYKVRASEQLDQEREAKFRARLIEIEHRGLSN